MVMMANQSSGSFPYPASSIQNPSSNIRRRHLPERTCVGCRTKKEKEELIRFHAFQGSLRAALGAEEGRGVYLCPSLRCAEAALKKHAFQRALKGQVEVPNRDAILEMSKLGIFKKIASLLSLARRAGMVSFGRAAVEGSLKMRRVHLLLLACDAKAQDLTALRAKALASDVPVLAILTKGELGDALGRRELAVVAVKDPHFAQGLLRYAALESPVSSLPSRPGRR